MFTFAIISQKGGAGKTTLALNLAVASELAGRPALVLDLDPQGSASAWGDSREAETPVVAPTQPYALGGSLRAAREAGAELVIVDTAPHAEQVALSAAREADLVVIPCRSSILDLRAVTASRDIAALARTPAVAVLNATPPRGFLGGDAAAALRGHELAVAPIQIGQRADFVHAATASCGVLETRPDGKAAAEILALHDWLYGHVNMLTRGH